VVVGLLLEWAWYAAAASTAPTLIRHRRSVESSWVELVHCERQLRDGAAICNACDRGAAAAAAAVDCEELGARSQEERELIRDAVKEMR